MFNRLKFLFVRFIINIVNLSEMILMSKFTFYLCLACIQWVSIMLSETYSTLGGWVYFTFMHLKNDFTILKNRTTAPHPTAIRIKIVKMGHASGCRQASKTLDWAFGPVQSFDYSNKYAFIFSLNRVNQSSANTAIFDTCWYNIQTWGRIYTLK